MDSQGPTVPSLQHMLKAVPTESQKPLTTPKTMARPLQTKHMTIDRHWQFITCLHVCARLANCARRCAQHALNENGPKGSWPA
eukprot:13556608-Alexandrium_andersonii.AAC.1